MKRGGGRRRGNGAGQATPDSLSPSTVSSGPPAVQERDLMDVDAQSDLGAGAGAGMGAASESADAAASDGPFAAESGTIGSPATRAWRAKSGDWWLGAPASPTVRGEDGEEAASGDAAPSSLAPPDVVWLPRGDRDRMLMTLEGVIRDQLATMESLRSRLKAAEAARSEAATEERKRALEERVALERQVADLRVTCRSAERRAGDAEARAREAVDAREASDARASQAEGDADRARTEAAEARTAAEGSDKVAAEVGSRNMQLAREIDEAGHELAQARQALRDCEERERVARADAEAARRELEEARKAHEAAGKVGAVVPASSPTPAAAPSAAQGGQGQEQKVAAPTPAPAPAPAPARNGASQTLEEARRQAADARTQLGVAEGMKQYLAHKWAEADERCKLLHRTNQELRTDLSAAKRRAAEAEKFRDAMLRRMQVSAGDRGLRLAIKEEWRRVAEEEDVLPAQASQ